MFSFFQRLWRGESAEAGQAPAFEALIKPENETPDLSFDDDESRAQAFYTHTQKRVRQRYNLSITRQVWVAWNEAIRDDRLEVLFLEQTDEGSIWRVWYGARKIFVMFKNDMVVTALPNRGQFDRSVDVALNERAAQGETTDTVCVQSMPPPPRQKRPQGIV